MSDHPDPTWRFWCPQCEAYVPLVLVERNPTTQQFVHVLTQPDGVSTCPGVLQIRKVS